MYREILVKDQNPNNLFKLNQGHTNCCGDAAVDPCQYVATYAAANSLSALNILDQDGNAKTLTISPAVTGVANVKAAIHAALKAYGAEEDQQGVIGLTVVPSSTNVVVTIIGEVKMVSLVQSGGTTTFTATCNLTLLCTYAIGNLGALTTPNLRINGGDHALITFVPGTTTTGQIKTSVEGALTAAGVTGTVTVTSTGSSTATLYTISIVGGGGNTFVFNSAYMERSACAQTWVA